MATTREEDENRVRSLNNSFEAVEHYQISIDKLIPYHKQSRIHFNEEDINNLTKSIKEHGVRQPLTIIQSTSGEDKYEVVSGERRLKAAKLAGLKKLPCFIISDPLVAEEIALVENVQREDLHPIELGEALSKILESRVGLTQTELSDRVGLSNKRISELIQYTKLPQEVKEYVVSNQLTGRDYLRKLIKSEDPLNLIAGQRNLSTSKKSVLRVVLDGGEFHVQFTQLKFLDDAQKERLRKLLSTILGDV